MKSIIVYYSLTGNVDYVARKVAEKLDSDILPLTVLKAYPDKGFKKFYWGGKSAVMKESPELNEYKFDKNEYDLVILGTPVWAGTFTPPLRTFIKENDLKNIKLSFFACCSGTGTTRAINNLKKEIGINSKTINLELVDPKDNNNDYVQEKINEYCEKIKDAYEK